MTAYVWSLSSVHGFSPVYITIRHRILMFSVQYIIYWVCLIILCYVAVWILYFICAFPCMYSEITFLRRSHLRRHKRKHTEQKGVCSLKSNKYIINILSFKNLWCNNCTFWLGVLNKTFTYMQISRKRLKEFIQISLRRSPTLFVNI